MSVREVVIVGGDIAGWTVAAGVANSLKGSGVNITLLELPDLINVEPVQYTAPASLEFFEHLGIEIDELISQTGATFRLGTGLHDVTADGDHRISAFGPHGGLMGFVRFQHYITRARQHGQELALNDYTPNAVAARNGKFIRPTEAGAERMPPLTFGLNLNTEKLTRLLSSNATVNGVGVARGALDAVRLSDDGSRIDSLQLDDGSSLVADLYIDCSGESALLIGAALGVPFVDWSAFLPCSRAMGATAKTEHDNIPVHHCTATDRGWLLSTPLQHRTACRFLYSPAQVSDDDAADEVNKRLGVNVAEAVAFGDTPSGHRREIWLSNCVAMGAAAGAVEPLDLSSFHSVQSAVLRLMRLWPSASVQPELAAEFNRAAINELECLRDFARLRYVNAGWPESPFWQRVELQVLPDTLESRLALYRSRGRVLLGEYETWPWETWLAAFNAADVQPEGYDPLLDSMGAAQLQQHFANMKVAVAQAVAEMPGHRDYLKQLTG